MKPNCTILELKYEFLPVVHSEDVKPNCTILELKLVLKSGRR